MLPFQICRLPLGIAGIVGISGIRQLELNFSHSGEITSDLMGDSKELRNAAFRTSLIAEPSDIMLPAIPISEIKTEKDILSAFPHCFCNEIEDMGGGSTIIAPKLTMKTDKPVYRAQYPIPNNLLPQVKDLVDKLTKGGIVERSTSLWNSPLFPVVKSDGSVRITLDLRHRGFPFPIPRIEENLRAFTGAKIFSTIDLTSGFFQIHLPEEDREFFAFSLPWGRYHFTRLTQGAKNSAQVFQLAMNIVFGDLLYKCVRLYIDDVIVYSDSYEQHILDLVDVFECLSKFRLKAKRGKSHFFQQSVEYLGHIIDQNGIKPATNNILALQSVPRPKNIKGVRSFLGLVNYYRRFIPQAGDLLAPLNDLLKNGRKFLWESVHQEAFDQVIARLTSSPILVHPDPNKPYLLYTDASGIAVGACLCQEEDGASKPIAYFSKKLHGPELRYSTIEKETFAIVLSLQHFKHLLIGSKIDIHTDHKPIMYNKGADYKNLRLSRWAEFIQDFNVTYHHVAGRDNVVADFLSRFPHEEEKPGGPDGIVAAMTCPDSVFMPLSTDLCSELKNEPHWMPIIEKLNANNPMTELKKKFYQLDREGNLRVLGKKGTWLLVIPLRKRSEVIRYHHDLPSSGHFGVRKTLVRLRESYFWHNMTQDVKKYIQHCNSCQYANPGVIKSANTPHFWPNHPFEHLAIDFIGPLEQTPSGNSSILTIIDLFTKFPILVATPNQKSETVARILISDVISHYGVPKTILSDRGTVFMSRSNGAAERLNRTVIESLRKCASGSSWDELLPLVAMSIRSTLHASTGYSPAKLLYGYEMRLPELLGSDMDFPIPEDNIHFWAREYDKHFKKDLEEVHTAVRQAYAKEREGALRNFHYHKLREFEPGELVLVERKYHIKGVHKFQPRFAGPYKVIRRAGLTVYLLEDMTTKARDKYHIDRIKLYHQPIAILKGPQEGPEDDTDEPVLLTPAWVNHYHPPYLNSRTERNQGQEATTRVEVQKPSELRRSTRKQKKDWSCGERRPLAAAFACPFLNGGHGWDEEPKEHKIIEGQVKEMSDKGIYRNPTSPVLVQLYRKRNQMAQNRFCVDYRKRGSHILYLILTTGSISRDDILPLSDFVSGYWKCSLDKESKPITTGTDYTNLILPFGLTGTPGNFERIMNMLLAELKLSESKMTSFYMATIYRNERLGNVLQCFQEAKLSLKSSKCRFAHERLPNLCHVVSENGVEPATDKIEGVRNFPITKKKRCFIKNFVKICKPLACLMGKDKKFVIVAPRK
ncbi:K02A2.6-like [Cordylochernes scorpioides]|uniref:RNA-directed DNA polymerase n=1 Tax=Cordylochernes scorpioides TaxID=51811 RepID=A0ABY6LNA1_9ARAC|nr:K02A2.6-like [Cordylochernes scorpioides]